MAKFVVEVEDNDTHRTFTKKVTADDETDMRIQVRGDGNYTIRSFTDNRAELAEKAANEAAEAAEKEAAEAAEKEAAEAAEKEAAEAAAKEAVSA